MCVCACVRACVHDTANSPVLLLMSTLTLRRCAASGGGSSMRVGGTQRVWGTEVLQRGPGAEPRKGSGRQSPAEVESFKKNMCKILSNPANIFKTWQFYKQYFLFIVRLTTSEKRHISYIFAKYDQFMPNLLPKCTFHN